MLKRKSQIFCIAVVAIICLFMATDVLAEVKEIDIGGCVFTAEGPIFDSDKCDVEPCAVFEYTIDAECSKSQFALALPDPMTYCPWVPETELWYNDSVSNCSEPWPALGAGDDDTKWYKDDFSMRVIEITADVTGFYIVTTAKVAPHPTSFVAAHPTPVLLKKGNKNYYGTTLGPNCAPPPPPPPPVAVSGVSTTTPEGCTLKLDQNMLPKAYCPDDNGTMQEVDVYQHDTADVYLGFPVPDPKPTGWECKSDIIVVDVPVTDKDLCLEPFKYLSDQAFGRVGESSVGWYYWNGTWYSYTY